MVGSISRHRRFDFFGSRRDACQGVGVVGGGRRPPLGLGLGLGRGSLDVVGLGGVEPRDPPLPADSNDARKDKEQKEASHQGVAAHEPSVVTLGKVKVGSGVHLDQQRRIARGQDAEKDATAQKEDAKMLADATIGVPDALRGHDLERREKAADAFCARALFAVGQGLGSNVGQDQAGVDGRGHQQEEGDVKGHADAKRVANVATQEQAGGLPEHDAPLQLAKHGGPLHGLDDLAGNGVDDKNVACGPAEDGDELGGLDDGDASGAAGQDADDLAAGADGGDQCLQEQGEPWPPSLDGPARDEEVDGAAEGGAHAEQRKLRGRAGGDLVDSAAVAGAGVRGM